MMTLDLKAIFLVEADMSKTKKVGTIAVAKNSVAASEYRKTLSDIKKHIRQAQIKAALAANKELVKLYWYIGKTIVNNQKESGWGSNVIEQLAKDLQNEFPGIAGFSRTNVFNMRAFYLAYEKVQQVAGQIDELPFFNIPWWHNVILLAKLKDTDERFWYAQKSIENGWSRNTLELWLESDLYHREGKAITNFSKTLTDPQSDMAQQSLKDPYLFDFLTLHEAYVEKDVEQGLIDHIQKFLLELGQGFAFVGRQVHLHVGHVDYYIDLLFYHFKLRCFIVIELKVGKFDPRDVGQINFYLSAVDDVMRSPDDKPTIGLLLCKTKDNVTAEYALRNISSPIGVAEYTTKLVEKLPKELKGSLPTIEEIEAGISKKEDWAKAQKARRKK
jgi:predicted nuclease of restriction endonuclease-like (RecB) superfamily